MPVTPKPLFQTVLDNTLKTKLYQATLSARLEQIIFVNLDVATRKVTLFHDMSGEDYTDATTIMKSEDILAGEKMVFSVPLLFDNVGSLGAQVDAADVVTITGYGWEDI